MKKLDLYNQALSVMDSSISDLTTSCKELTLLNINFNKTVMFCLKAWDFQFLVKRVTMSETDLSSATYDAYLYGYAIPSDLLRVVRLNQSNKNGYAIRFNTLWCDIENPEVEYMPKTLEEDENGNFTAPDDFLSLVAYQLALHVAPMLDPGGESQGIAAQMYQLTLSSIMESESRSNDRPNNFDASPNWVDEDIMSLADYRRLLFEESR